MMRLPMLLCLFVGSTYSLVEFTNSAVYDIKDFRGMKEVQIKKCDSGCLIFAATQGEAFVQYPDRLDPYAMDLLLVDNDKGTNISIANLALQKDQNGKKIPLTITGKGSLTVVNQNDASVDFYAADLVLYVVDKSTAAEFSYEVYDVYYTSGKTIKPQSEIVTILGGYAIGIRAESGGQSNSVTARLVGFDNALDNNKDGCPYAYKTSDVPSFPGFNILAKPPIVSLVVGKKNDLQFRTDLALIANSSFDMGSDGFFTTYGWNGCTKLKGGFQSYKSRDAIDNDMYIISSNDNDFNVTLEVVPNFDAKHYLTIENTRNDKTPTKVTGTETVEYDFTDTNYIIAFFQSMTGDQGFLLRYSSTLIPKPTTTGPAVSSTVTATITTPTTSSGFRASEFVLSIFLIALLL